MVGMTGLAFAYYASYGRLHNKVRPQLNITYQQSPTKTPLIVVNTEPSEVNKTKPATGGACTGLSKEVDVHAMYIASAAKDCGAANDNESVIDEAQSKKIRSCLEENMQNGSCGQAKAFLTLQGFEGAIDVFLETSNCALNVRQWSPTSPECGFTEKNCQNISERFPFAVCG